MRAPRLLRTFAILRSDEAREPTVSRDRLLLWVGGSIVVLSSSGAGVAIAASLPGPDIVAERWVPNWAALATFASPLFAFAGLALLLAIGGGRRSAPLQLTLALGAGLVANCAVVALSGAVVWAGKEPGLGGAMVSWQRVFDVGLIKALFALWVLSWLGFLGALFLRTRVAGGRSLALGMLALFMAGILIPSSVVSAGASAYVIESAARNGEGLAWVALLPIVALLLVANVAGGVVGRLIWNRALVGGLAGLLIALLVLVVVALAGILFGQAEPVEARTAAGPAPLTAATSARKERHELQASLAGSDDCALPSWGVDVSDRRSTALTSLAVT